MTARAHSTRYAARDKLGIDAGVWLLPYVVSCAGAPPPSPAAPALATASVSHAATPPSADPLGPRPETPTAPPFIPPTPEVFGADGGMTVWLLERHQLPLVSCDLTVPTGASSDPRGKAGLTYVTAHILDERAGARGAVDLAPA